MDLFKTAGQIRQVVGFLEKKLELSSSEKNFLLSIGVEYLKLERENKKSNLKLTSDEIFQEVIPTSEQRDSWAEINSPVAYDVQDTLLKILNKYAKYNFQPNESYAPLELALYIREEREQFKTIVKDADGKFIDRNFGNFCFYSDAMPPLEEFLQNCKDEK